MAEPAGTAPRRQLERECKLDVDAGFLMPTLSGLGQVVSVDPPVNHELAATYFDTLDLRLLARSITLRRRAGGPDAGWHLKLPEAPGVRAELCLPLGAGEPEGPPEPLLRLVRVLVRRRALRPALVLTTHRTVRVLRDVAGQPLAEVADDEVVAYPLQYGTQRRWREVEVELCCADPELLETVAARLVAAGAEPSDAESKPARVLGGALPGPLRMPEKPRAGDVLRDHLADLLEELMRRDPQVRLDAPDAVHRMRVATRRLRSALANFADLLSAEVVRRLRDELAWLGELLGAARDAEVMRDRLVGLIDAEPSELVLGPVRGRVEAELGERYLRAHAAVVAALDGPRYLDLVDALDWLCRQPVESPPWTSRATRPARRELARAMRRTWRRVRRRARAAERAPASGDASVEASSAGAVGDLDPALHEVRKAAKRARYAAETTAGVFGAPARRFAKRMARLQDTLGAHQDSVVTRAVLLELAERAERAGEPAFSYGRLHGLEQRRAVSTEAAYRRQFADASRRSVTRWMG